MRKEFYSETTGQLLFSLYDSFKQQRTDYFRNHRHADMELGFIINGTGIYQLDQTAYESIPGDLFMIRPNQQHCIPVISTEFQTAFHIRINSYYLWNVCADYIAPEKLHAMIHSDRPIRQHFSMNERMKDLSTKIAQLFHENVEDNRFAIRNYVLEFVKLLSEEISIPETNTAFPCMRLEDIQKAINYIKKNYQNSINLDDIAQAATMSRSYLTDTFRLVTGTTPYEYLLATRLEKAVSLLLDTDLSILQIAYDCGFQSIASFNRAFKKKMGTTPSAMRQEHSNQS